VDRACRGNGRCEEFPRPKTCFISESAHSLMEMTMDEQKAYASDIAAEAVPQFVRRTIDQSGDFAIKLGQVRVSQSVLPAAVWTENGRRLARELASRSIVDWRFHRLAGSAIR
jgi:hypothetical protein